MLILALSRGSAARTLAAHSHAVFGRSDGIFKGGFKDMLVSSLILMRRGEGGIDSEAAELESEIAAAKRTRLREAELKRKLGI